MRTAPISPELTLSLDPAILTKLLRVFGSPKGAAKGSPLAIAQLLFEAPSPPSLAAEALGIEDEIEPWRLATDEQVLVVERSTQRVWLAGVALTELSDAVFKMIETLALANGGVVPVKELGDAISPGSSYPDVVVRKARARFEKQLEESFASAGVELPKELAHGVIVMDGKRRGYRVGVGVLVR